jgi:hypothetical protein
MLRGGQGPDHGGSALWGRQGLEAGPISEWPEGPTTRNPVSSLLFLALFAAGCGGSSGEGSPAPASPDSAAAPWFSEEAAQRGLVFRHTTGRGERYLYPEIVCGGGALFDMDGDGDLDAYLVQSGGVTTAPADRPGNALFENAGDGTFTDVSAASGADDRGYGMGVATGDYDGDGDLDLYVTNLGGNVLYRNEGGGRFVDVTAEAGVGEELWSTSASFLDYDRDGDLDLWVVNYIFWTVESERTCYAQPHGETYCGPLAYDEPAPDTLYRNEGDGTFTDVSIPAGVRKSFGNGLGIGVSDFDGDGWLDVFVANDGTKDQLWINREGERFVERGVAFGCAADQDGQIKAGMGVAVVDLDDDADEDLLVVNLDDEYDTFFVNQGTHFVDRTATVGLTTASQAFTRFGVGFVDFDHDGRLDLYEANGRVSHGPESTGADPFAEENLLYRGQATGRFEVVLPRGGTAAPLVATSRAAAFGDVDGDGAVDVLVVNREGPAHLLINRAARASDGGWIRFRLVEGGRDALGAVLTLSLGDRTLTRRARTSTSYCAANDARIHVGLGDAESVGDLRVRWADGAVESFGSRAAGQDWTLVRGEGER